MYEAETGTHAWYVLYHRLFSSTDLPLRRDSGNFANTWLRCVCFSPDSTLLVTGGDNKQIQVGAYQMMTPSCACMLLFFTLDLGYRCEEALTGLREWEAHLLLGFLARWTLSWIGITGRRCTHLGSERE